MAIFLTSSPTGSLDGSYQVDGLDRSNHFVDNLRSRWKETMDCMIISAFPDNYEADDEMTSFFHGAFEKTGLSCGRFDCWDYRSGELTEETLSSYDVVILGGGHVPTENAYFHALGLRDMILNYSGIIIGISAGSMNAADLVYAQPEEAGESVDPSYQRWLTGLGLTTTQIIPHYQMVKDHWLDGRRLYEDITYTDSKGHVFLALVDGSYLMVDHGHEMIYGEAYVIEEGKITKVSGRGDIIPWK